MKLMDVAIYLVYVATYIIVVPIGIGLYFFKNLPQTLKILLVGLMVVLILDLLLLLFNLKATVTFLYLFSIVDIVMMSWIFSLVVVNSIIRSNMLIFSTLFVVYIVLDAFFISGLTNSGVSNALEKVYILAIAIYYLTQLFQENIEIDLLKTPLFWMSIGVILYNLVGTFDVFSSPIISYSQTLYLQYYTFWSIVTIFMYGAFSYAFGLCRNS